jgi:subtilisin family serine protease
MFCDEIRRLADQGGRRGNGVVVILAAGHSNCPIADEFRASVDVPVDSGRDNSGAFVGPRTARVFKNELVGLPSVVHVGAVASTARRSHYSNYGAGLSLSAPSDNRNLYSCGKAPGLQLRCDPSNQPGGTSASAAIVAGTAALVVSAYPALTARQVISILQSTATRDLDLTPYPRSQFPDCGTGDFDVSPVPPFDDGAFKDVGRPDGTRSPWFGFGCVNGGRAVAEAALRRQASIAEKSAESAAV